MRIFKNRLGTGRYYFLFAIAFSLLVFPLPTQSANEKQDPTVTSKQIEALPRSTSPGQSSDDRVALYQALLDLTNPWTVMCIAAHPDDEDGTSLIVMRRKYGAHTVSLFSTFGEGGQNAIGPELYEELGAMRARETMAAAEIQGSEPHFLGLKDFGYSKSADEAFKFWGHEEALRRMVLEIRKLRPDVIITNHSVTSNDHGHHQATARLELEAFDASADPKRFPEQLKDGVTTWQVQRLFVRVRGNTQAQADNSPVVTIDPNERDPARGVVYAEEALRALQKHATQGPWPKTFAEFAARFRAFSGQSAAPGQLPLIRYRLVHEAKGAESLPKDSHNFLDGLRLPEKIARQLEMPTIDGRPLVEFMDDRKKILAQLVGRFDRGVYGLSFDRSDESRSFLMRGRLLRALARTAGIIMSVEPSRGFVMPGSSANLAVKIGNAGIQTVEVGDCRSDIRSLETPTHSSKLNLSVDYSGPVELDSLASGATVKRSTKVRILERAPINIPLASHLYEPDGLGLQVHTLCSIIIAKAHFSLEANTHVDVAPAVEIAAISPSPLVLTPGIAELPSASGLSSRPGSAAPVLKIRLINHRDSAFSGELIGGDLKNKSAPRSSVKLQAKEESIFTVPASGWSSAIDSTRSGAHSIPNVIPFSVMKSGSAEPITTVRVHAVWAEARVAPNLRVGYIRGFDFSLPNALNALGVESKELTLDEFKTADLSRFTSIIVDNRVYESQLELIAANQKLLDYANAGGTLIVFYHKSDEWNPDPRRNRPQLAPYKLILGNERITDENAPVTFIEPQHPLLNVPNKIGPDDFKDWIQERGLYYPREWDPQFHALLQSNDPGEAPLKGGLLVADYGKGHYIYSSMVWYRQLRAGVPGAYRMLANMISYGHR